MSRGHRSEEGGPARRTAVLCGHLQALPVAAETNLQIIIDQLPRGPLKPADFRIQEVPAPKSGDLGKDEVLCESLVLGLYAGQRAGLQGSATYTGAPKAGDVMNGPTVARVRGSTSAAIPVGALVVCDSGWQRFSVKRASGVQLCQEAALDPAHYLGVLGNNGLTAYFGLFDVGKPKEGETVLVSAAAGSVGHIVCQLARAAGCRVVAVAGSAEKCRLLKERVGVAEVLNYKDQDFKKQVRRACPGGISVFFDNTGGVILEAALFNMALGGRVVCCGNVSQYDTSTPGPSPRGVPGLLVNNRVTMQGFVVYDFAARFAEAQARLRELMDTGKLTPLLDEFQGLESAPAAFVDLLAGGNFGTRVVRLRKDG